MTIRVITDSTSDIPDELQAEYGITVIPAYVNIGDDGVDDWRGC